MYTSLYLLIVFVTLSSSMSILTPHGKTYSDSDNELVFGGQKVLKINPKTISGLKSYRELADNEKIKLHEQELLDIQREKDRKQCVEEREKEEKLRDEENNRRWKQHQIELQNRRNEREMYLKQQDEERRLREEERSQRGLLINATPYYGSDNSYLGRRQLVEDYPMLKKLRKKQRQQQKREAEKRNIHLSLPNTREQEHSDEDGVEERPMRKAKRAKPQQRDVKKRKIQEPLLKPSEQKHCEEDGAEECPMLKTQSKKNKLNSDSEEEESETKTAKREMDRSQRRRDLERREGIQIQHKIEIVKSYPVRRLNSGANVKKPQCKRCFEVSSENEDADKPKKPIKSVNSNTKNTSRNRKTRNVKN